MSREVFVLKSGKCSWGRCVFCGYGRIYGERVDVESLISKIKPVTDEVCVYGSGSFLDERQVPAESRRYFIEKCAEKNIRKITIESRPEYVRKECLEGFKGFEYSVAIGLEVADDRILKKINKGFTLKDFEDAAETIHKTGGKVRTYLLVNPPHVKDVKKSLDTSVEYTLKHADSIVLINTLPHANAPLFDLWISGEWNFLSKSEFTVVTAKWAKHPKIELDAETFKFTPKFPERLKKPLAGVGEEYLTHPHFEVWQDWLIRWYTPPKGKKILLFLPCAYKKPYSKSETHKKIIEVLEKTGKRRILHEVMLSNAGLIPREFEDEYPFNAYDWNEKLETPEIKERYIQVTTQRIQEYLLSHREAYEKMLCFLKYESESYKALAKTTVEVTNLLTEKTYKKIKNDKTLLTQEEALKDLASGITDEVR